MQLNLICQLTLICWFLLIEKHPCPSSFIPYFFPSALQSEHTEKSISIARSSHFFPTGALHAMDRTRSTARPVCVWIHSRVRPVFWMAIQLLFRVTRGQRNSLSDHLAQGRRGAHATQGKGQPLNEEEVALLRNGSSRVPSTTSIGLTSKRCVRKFRRVHPVDHFIRKRLQAEESSHRQGGPQNSRSSSFFGFDRLASQA